MMMLFGACASVPEVPEKPKALVKYDPPKWVIQGGGAYTDDYGKAFYGVGSATGIRNYSLQRVVADDRARNDLAKTAGDFSVSSEEQDTEAAIKTVTANVLRGVIIVDHYEIPQRRELLSLARLDYDAFKRNVDRVESFQQLPKQLQKDIKERAEKLHQEMEVETKKLKNGHNLWADEDQDY